MATTGFTRQCIDGVSTFRKKNRKLSALCLPFAILAGTPTFAQAITLEELAQKLEAVEMQNAELQAKVRKLESEQNKQAAQVQQQAVAVEQAQQTASTAVQASSAASWAANTSISSYGEIGYSRPTRAAQNTQVDVGRAVIGITHRFDDKTKFVGEFEYEHAIVSSTDRGEAEVEQLYVEREFKNGLRAKAGLHLMPAGFLNQTHEPTTYHGVFRNFVESTIIPTTWREAGLGLSGTNSSALSWDIGLTTGFDLTKWDVNATEGRIRGPLQATHGEGQFANARDLSTYAALNWRGIPGLQIGGFIFTGKVGHRRDNFNSTTHNSSLTLYDLHARYQVSGWDFSALYSRGSISNTEGVNANLSAAATAANPTLIPSKFYGGYVQAAYKLLQWEDYSLHPFARYERFNTAAGYGSLSATTPGAAAQPDEKVFTAGLTLRVGKGVVLKTDYQKFGTDKTRDRFNVGMGYSF